ncbi:MAG: aminotransferase class I/II-fold pyridoxal phosphate-dependent enzyme, partial [Lachnospiraceae bacterium]|nr:aminotransferase class I/II-fold pyridoxal phosphate-dependent enzyme [Lachnospiraceae bacterium]
MSNDRELYELLTEYGKSDYYPFHMPGHKRNKEFLKIAQTDITEVEGFDDLHSPHGILRGYMERAAKVFGAQETYFLVNGSTGGLLAGIGAATKGAGKVVMARGCHRSVYNAVIINKLTPVYIYPEIDQRYGFYKGVTAAQVRAVLDENDEGDVSAVAITSPTYDGIVSDVKGIAEVCHERDIPLIVDEAHGAHFAFSNEFPVSAVKYADIVVNSTHKTLNSLTQTALLHARGKLIDRKFLHYALTCYQSSSPSYILMASLDSCVRFAARSKARFTEFALKAAEIRKRINNNCKHLYIVDNDDVSRFVIADREGRSVGTYVYRRLYEDYHLQLEMFMPFYATAILTVFDTDEGLKRLEDAVCELDKRIESEGLSEMEPVKYFPKRTSPGIIMTPYEAGVKPWHYVPLEESEGLVAADYIYLYPPGSPIIVPGERMDSWTMERLRRFLENGFSPRGIKDGKIR